MHLSPAHAGVHGAWRLIGYIGNTLRDRVARIELGRSGAVAVGTLPKLSE